MIVKNEAKVIKRCLASVLPIIDTWVIVDTGSTDGTQDIIQSFLKRIPGQLHERVWQNFAANRNEAIELAKEAGDYLFVIDADDILEIGAGFSVPDLTAHSYQVRVNYADTTYFRTHFFESSGFHYEGVLHEALVCESEESSEKLAGLTYRCLGGGGRSEHKDKYRKDAATLEEALHKEPSNTRYAFYLAQSWRDAKEWEKALEAYERRVQMGGWAEEVFVSLLEIGRLNARLGNDPTEAYLRAFEFRPTRAEPLYHLAKYLRAAQRVGEAYPFAKAASELPRPDDVLFVDASVYQWRALDEYATAAFWCGHYEEAISANSRLLKCAPEEEHARIRKNLGICLKKLELRINAA